MDNTYKALDDLIAPSVEDIIRVVAESNRL